MDSSTTPGVASFASLNAAVDDNVNEMENLPDPDEGLVLFPEGEESHQFHPDATKKRSSQEPEEAEYMLGTIIVRVVAARGLVDPNQSDGRFSGVFRNASASAPVNPYASVKFGKTTQRTSSVYSTLNPVWPRDEIFFMDVSLPMSQLNHTLDSSISDEMMPSPSFVEKLEDNFYGYKKPDNTTLTVAIFHTEMENTKRRHKNCSEKQIFGDSDDAFLGMASIDLNHLLTGKVSEIDRWVQLTGTTIDSFGNKSSQMASVRIMCEYEVQDAPPKVGDICRFTRFCHPRDLYPLEPARSYKVEQVRNNGDVICLSYESQEGWFLSFQAHKNMLICEERHVSALNTAQDELQTLGERLKVSPLVTTVTQTAERVVDDGIVGIAEEVVKGSAYVFDRWFRGGVETVIQDIQDITNLDGRLNVGSVSQGLDLESPSSSSSSFENDNMEGSSNLKIVQESFPEKQAEALPNMPACPITGFPMVRYRMAKSLLALHTFMILNLVHFLSNCSGF